MSWKGLAEARHSIVHGHYHGLAISVSLEHPLGNSATWIAVELSSHLLRAGL